MKRDDLVRQLDSWLESDDRPEYGPNGLQFEGVAEVQHVVTAVTASERTIREAAELGADALVVHHGILWNGSAVPLVGWHGRRVRALVETDLNLIAYHLPLDQHATLGNNVPVLTALGAPADEVRAMSHAKGYVAGFHAELAKPLPKAEFLSRVREIYGIPAEEELPFAFLEGPDEVRTVAIASGGAQGEAHVIAAKGFDAFLTGEVSEYNVHLAREARFHHLSLGHHRSETIGPRLLGDRIAAELDLKVDFLEVPNPA